MADSSREALDAPQCPVCEGTVELTPSGYLTCREHGSEHYRVPFNPEAVAHG